MGTTDMLELPKSDWPEAVRICGPRAVRIGAAGVYLEMHRFVVTESGVFVAFEGTAPPAADAVEPTFKRLWDGIYWYHLAG
jgi:hypothetical protein